MLSPIVRQFLMKHCPEALNVETRGEFESVILKKRKNGNDFKMTAWEFFMEKHKLPAFDSFDTLPSDSLCAVESAGFLKDFRRFESELFGSGKYFIVGNEFGIEDLHFSQVDDLGYALKVFNVGGETLDDDIDEYTEDNINTLNLRGIVNNTPSSITIMDIGAYLIEEVAEFISNHIKTITPHSVKLSTFIDEDGEEMVEKICEYENPLHSPRFIAMLENEALDYARVIILDRLEDFGDKIKIIESEEKEVVGMMKYHIIIKDLKAFENMTKDNMFDGETDNSCAMLDDTIEALNSKMMDFIDKLAFEKEEEEKEHERRYYEQQERKAKKDKGTIVSLVNKEEPEISLDYRLDREVMPLDEYEELANDEEYFYSENEYL